MESYLRLHVIQLAQKPLCKASSLLLAAMAQSRACMVSGYTGAKTLENGAQEPQNQERKISLARATRAEKHQEEA